MHRSAISLAAGQFREDTNPEAGSGNFARDPPLARLNSTIVRTGYPKDRTMRLRHELFTGLVLLAAAADANNFCSGLQ